MLEKNNFAPNITIAVFGKTPDGQLVSLFTLKNNHGITAKLINYGATLVSLKMLDKSGQFDDITLGFDTLPEYLAHGFYFGCVVGRVANRITNGCFTLNSQIYQLPINFIQQHHMLINAGPINLAVFAWKHKTFLMPSIIRIFLRLFYCQSKNIFMKQFLNFQLN